MFILTVGFEFNDESYSVLIRVQQLPTHSDYEIITINKKLDAVLAKYRIIRQINNHLEVDFFDTSEKGLLIFAIAAALGNFLKIPLRRKLKNEMANLN